MSVGVDVPGGAPRGRARAPRRGRPATRRSPRPRSSGSATSGSTTCSRPRPIPRRRADEAFAATIYSAGSPYRRPSGGTKETVAELDAGRLRAAYERGLDPTRATLVVGGDLARDRRRGDRRAAARVAGARASGRDEPAGSSTPRARSASGSSASSIGRASVQTEIRIGHVGVPRRIDGLPRAVGHGRDPRRAVQLPAEHEAPRGEGLHVRRRRRLRPPPRAPGRSPPAPR